MIPFRAKGIPATLQIEDMENEFNPYYHSPEDSIAHMNIDYWIEQIKATIAIVAHLAVPVTEEINPPQLYIKKGGVSEIYPGEYLSYSIEVKNSAQVPAEPAWEVVISDTIPALTTFVSASEGTVPDANRVISYTFPYLAVGQREIFNFTVQVSNSVSGDEVITNTAHASAEGLPIVTDSITTTIIIERRKTYLPVMMKAH